MKNFKLLLKNKSSRTKQWDPDELLFYNCHIVNITDHSKMCEVSNPVYFLFTERIYRMYNIDLIAEYGCMIKQGAH